MENLEKLEFIRYISLEISLEQRNQELKCKGHREWDSMKAIIVVCWKD
jgi:hypothetical protein